jgi:hypothetical protein
MNKAGIEDKAVFLAGMNPRPTAYDLRVEHTRARGPQKQDGVNRGAVEALREENGVGQKLDFAGLKPFQLLAPVVATLNRRVPGTGAGGLRIAFAIKDVYHSIPDGLSLEFLMERDHLL